MLVLLMCGASGCQIWCLNGEDPDECVKECGKDQTVVDGVCVRNRFISCCECLAANGCIEADVFNACVAEFAEDRLPLFSRACFEANCTSACLAPREGAYQGLGER